MRFSARFRVLARLFFSAFVFALLFATASLTPVLATTPQVAPSSYQNPETLQPFTSLETDASVPQNHHSYTQVIVIDVLSAMVCQIAGIDPLNPSQPCLAINPLTHKIGMPQDGNQFGTSSETTPKLSGGLGAMAGMIGIMYTPTVSATEYNQYLSNNFGIVKTTLAAGATVAPPPGDDCSKSPIGYGACSLKPIFKLWTISRDLAYALLVLAFVMLGLGVMTRFKVDPRTVMSLQNQIPRVIIAIVLITFSYPIAGLMIDLMWTATYTGINLISQGATVATNCGAANPNNASLGGIANKNLINQPISFTDAIFLRDCNGLSGNSGIVDISNDITDSVSALVISIFSNILGGASNSTSQTCGLSGGDDFIEGCLYAGLLWVTELIVVLIVLATIFIALFRLWFQLIKIYITTLLFIILGPIWIVMGLVPGRPMGFEKWLRLIFANLAAYPLVAFILVFGRVMVDSIPALVSPQSFFIPPLVGNPNIAAFSVVTGFAAILVAPSIPQEIRERMKVPQGKLGSTIGSGISAGAGVATAPATKLWAQTKRKDSAGNPTGTLAVFRSRAINRIPFIGRRMQARRIQERQNLRMAEAGTRPYTLAQRRAARGRIRNDL